MFKDCQVARELTWMSSCRWSVNFESMAIIHGLQLLGSTLLILLLVGMGQGQSLDARISIVPGRSPATVRVEGMYSRGSLVWSFRNTYGRVVGLGDRIQNLSLADVNGTDLTVRKIGPGEYSVARPAKHFRYEVSLGRPSNPADAAHISGLNSQYGYLMLADLLPQLPGPGVHLEFHLPEFWKVASSAPQSGSGYTILNADSSVFMVGRDLREVHKRVGALDLVIVSAGDWPFAGEALATVAAKIIERYRQHLGFNLAAPVVLMLTPFDDASGAERWSAETRGSNLVVVMGRSSSRRALLGQLSILLSHELFHLWVPNALNLEGDYDWFFEGFTLYEALCTAVDLGFIEFEEYLNTMARVYDSYRATPDRDRYSLVEISQRRWTTAASLVYDKGMLLAFLYDLKLRKASQSRRSLDAVYQELFRRFPPGSRPADGNEAIISILSQSGGAEEFVKYITTPVSIDLETHISDYGLKFNEGGGRKRLVAAETPSREQRDLLWGLGKRK